MKTHRISIFLLTLVLIVVIAFLYRENTHNEFHKSKMLQIQLLNHIVNTNNGEITKIKNKYPELVQTKNGYHLPAKAALKSEFLKEKGFVQKDFFGYFFKTNINGVVVLSGLHKP